MAFAAGANAYREAVKNAPDGVPSPERDLRNWLDTHSFPGTLAKLSWVYQDAIDPVDIAAQGAWTAAIQSFWLPNSLVNSFADSYTDSPTPVEIAPEPEDPFTPGGTLQALNRAREMISVPGGPSAFLGSNSFAWSGLYCMDSWPATTTYPGVLGDPHQPTTLFKSQFQSAGNHLWYAHIQVTPPDAEEPSLDVLGHFPHGSAAPFTSHNRNMAMAGTLGSPNHWDTFLLRLRENASATPFMPHEYYSYYHDTGGTNSTYQSVDEDMMVLDMPPGSANPTVSIPYWRLQSFGVVPPTKNDLAELFASAFLGTIPSPVTIPVVYGERVDPTQPWPRWRVEFPTPPDRMRFWNAPHFDGNQQPLTSPMVVAVRTPIDPYVDGRDMHLQLMRDFWQMSHADSVESAIDRTNGAAFRANVCFADRGGHTFSTVLSAIPQRGSDTELAAADYTSLEKWAIYQKSYGPVPARHFGDRMFDWQFGNYTNPVKPTSLSYLPYANTTATSLPTGPHKVMTFQDQPANHAIPPTNWSQAPFKIESGFFTSATNDMVWGYSRKRDPSQLVLGPGAPFSNGTVDNQLLQWALNEGVVYQSLVLAFEGPDRQQLVVDRFTKTADWLVNSGQSGLPPMTPAEVRQFVVTPALYRDSEYSPPAGVTTDPTLPVAIRQLKEVADFPAYSAPPAPGSDQHFESPLVSANKELDFFEDLWTTLFSTQWDNHVVTGANPPATVSLRDLWVMGSVPTYADRVFWYDDPTNAASVRWIELPHEFPLIDFYWPETEFGRGATAGANPDALSAGELQNFNSLVTQLVNWGNADYLVQPGSTGACLLQMMRQGYDGTEEFGRHWVRLKRGQVEYSTSGWTPLDTFGQLSGGVGSLVRLSEDWESLRSVAFPYGQHSSLLSAADDVPYDALYSDLSTRTVRVNLSPEHTNKLVKFFLELGRFYIDPPANGGNPSRKLARFNLIGQDEDAFVARYPANYPLTNGMRRVTAMRALLDAADYLATISSSGGGIPPFEEVFRARAYDQNGNKVWPPGAADADCVGESLRAVTWNPDPSTRVEHQGYQEKFLGLSGSIATMLALFPSTSTDVESYFWCTPGIELMTSDTSRFDPHMAAFAGNTLLPTNYDNFVAASVVTYQHTY